MQMSADPVQTKRERTEDSATLFDFAIRSGSIRMKATLFDSGHADSWPGLLPQQ
jgi:hypothetical protein